MQKVWQIGVSSVRPFLESPAQSRAVKCHFKILSDRENSSRKNDLDL